MTDKKNSWDEIPSIEDIGVEWDYKPESALGAREWPRIENSYLCTQLQVEKVPIKIASNDWESKGYVLDIGKQGVGLLAAKNIDPGAIIKIGLILGKVKILSRAIVRNCSNLDQRYRIGAEFIDLKETSKEYIASLVASKVYTGQIVL